MLWRRGDSVYMWALMRVVRKSACQLCLPWPPDPVGTMSKRITRIKHFEME